MRDRITRWAAVSGIAILFIAMVICLFMTVINLVAMVFAAIWLFCKAVLWLLPVGAAIVAMAWLAKFAPRRKVVATQPPVEVFAPDAPLPIRGDRPVFRVVPNE